MNRPPVFNPIGDKVVDEMNLLEFEVTVLDPELGDILTLTTGNLPSVAVFTDNGSGKGLFSWTPTPAQVGTYRVTFCAGNRLSYPIQFASKTITIAVDIAENEPIFDYTEPNLDLPDDTTEEPTEPEEILDLEETPEPDDPTEEIPELNDLPDDTPEETPEPEEPPEEDPEESNNPDETPPETTEETPEPSETPPEAVEHSSHTQYTNFLILPDGLEEDFNLDIDAFADAIDSVLARDIHKLPDDAFLPVFTKAMNAVDEQLGLTSDDEDFIAAFDVDADGNISRDDYNRIYTDLSTGRPKELLKEE